MSDRSTLLDRLKSPPTFKGNRMLGLAPKPLYERVKDYVVDRIRNGEWPTDFKIPSENELGDILGVSRITINRAFRDLAIAGRLRKVPGVGTFVSADRPHIHLTTIESIADTIKAGGHRHSCVVRTLRKEPVSPDVAYAMEITAQQPVYHSIVLHKRDSVPIQIEERYVLPAIAPQYLEQDYQKKTTFDYLREVAEVTDVEQVISAFISSKEVCKDLKMSAGEPCLFIRRRTWCRDRITTFSLLTHPATRFEISGKFPLHLLPLTREKQVWW
jgi:GntR family histidine utilization transcriptional repressor